MSLVSSYTGPSASALSGLDMSHIRLCPAIAFNKIVGGRYKLHILCVLYRGPRRFGEIGRSLEKGGLGKSITPRVLSRELKEMTEWGLISRKEFAGRSAEGGIRSGGQGKGPSAHPFRNNPMGRDRRP